MWWYVRSDGTVVVYMDVRTQIKILEFDVSAVHCISGISGLLIQLAVICKYPMKIAVAQGSYLMPAMVLDTIIQPIGVSLLCLTLLFMRIFRQAIHSSSFANTYSPVIPTDDRVAPQGIMASQRFPPSGHLLFKISPCVPAPYSTGPLTQGPSEERQEIQETIPVLNVLQALQLNRNTFHAINSYLLSLVIKLNPVLYSFIG